MRSLHPSITRLLVAINCSRFLAAAKGAAIGSAIGLIDIHSTNEDGINTSLAVLVAAAAIGLWHGGRSWQAWSPLGWCFYLMHRAAIVRGYRPPYVEEDANWAILSLYVLWPAGLGFVLGAFIRSPISRLLRSLGWTKRETDRPMDPRRALSQHPDLAAAERRPHQRLTVGGWLIVIALFGLHLAALRAAHPRAFPWAGNRLLGAVQRGPLHDRPPRDEPLGGGSDHGATAPRRPLESAHGAARRRDVVLQ